MSLAIHVFRSPDRFVAGTVGQTGNRTFYLPAVPGDRVARHTRTRSEVTTTRKTASQEAQFGGRTRTKGRADRKVRHNGAPRDGGQIRQAKNSTFWCADTRAYTPVLCVYKPIS